MIRDARTFTSVKDLHTAEKPTRQNAADMQHSSPAKVIVSYMSGDQDKEDKSSLEKTVFKDSDLQEIMNSTRLDN